MLPVWILVENLAWKKEVWSNDKKHLWKDWKYGHASMAVDGIDSTLLPQCAVMDNYYAETPIWMVDLGRKEELTGIVVTTWQGDGQGLGHLSTFRLILLFPVRNTFRHGVERQETLETYVDIDVFLIFPFVHTDKVTGYRDYVLNLERMVVYVSNKARLEASDLASETKCGSISRGNNALFQPKLRFECGSTSAKGRYIYIQATPVPNRWNQIFNFILCEVVVYKL